MNSPEPSLFNGANLNFDGHIKNIPVAGFTDEEEAEAAAEEQRRKHQLENEMANAFEDLDDEGEAFGEFDVSTDPSFHPEQLPTSTPFLVSSSGVAQRSLRDELVDNLADQSITAASDGINSYLVPEDTVRGATVLGDSNVSSGNHVKFVAHIYSNELSNVGVYEPASVDNQYHTSQSTRVDTNSGEYRNGDVFLGPDCQGDTFRGDEMTGTDNVSMLNESLEHTNTNDCLPKVIQAESGDGFTIDQLKILCEARGHEIDRLRQGFDQASIENANLMRKAEHRATLAVAERQIAESCQQQTNSKLLDKGNEILSLKGEIKSMELQWNASEDSRKKLIHQVQINDDTIASLEKKVREMHNFESISRNAAIHQDIIDSLKRKHEEELTSKQQQLDDVLLLLEEQKRTNSRIAKDLTAEIDSRQRLMSDKADVINKLTKSLEVAQKQYQNILESDIGNFHSRLTDEQRKRQLAEERASSMQFEVEMLKRDLQACESVLGVSTGEMLSKNTITPVDVNPAQVNLFPVDHSTILRKQLSQALESVHLYRNEIIELKRSLARASDHSSSNYLAKEFIDISVQTDLYSSIKLEEELNMLRNKFDIAESDLRDALNLLKTVESERDKLLVTVESLRERLSEQVIESDQVRIEAVEEVRQSCLRLHDDVVSDLKRDKNEKYENQIAQLNATIEQLEQGIAVIKKQYVSVCEENFTLNKTLEEFMNNSINKKCTGVQTTLCSTQSLVNRSNIQLIGTPTVYAEVQTQSSSNAEVIPESSVPFVAKNQCAIEKRSNMCGEDENDNRGYVAGVKDICTDNVRELSTVESLHSRLKATIARLQSVSVQSQKEKHEIVDIYEKQVQQLTEKHRLETEALLQNNQCAQMSRLEAECVSLQDVIDKERLEHKTLLKKRENEYNKVLTSYQMLMRSKAQELKIMEVELRSKLSGSFAGHNTDAQRLISENKKLDQLCREFVAAIQQERESCCEQLKSLTSYDKNMNDLKESLSKCRLENSQLSIDLRKTRLERCALLERLNYMREKLRSYHAHVKYREEHYNSELRRMEAEYSEALAKVKDHKLAKTAKSICSLSRSSQTLVSGENFNRKCEEVAFYREQFQQMKVSLAETFQKCHGQFSGVVVSESSNTSALDGLPAVYTAPLTCRFSTDEIRDRGNFDYPVSSPNIDLPANYCAGKTQVSVPPALRNGVSRMRIGSGNQMVDGCRLTPSKAIVTDVDYDDGSQRVVSCVNTEDCMEVAVPAVKESYLENDQRMDLAPGITENPLISLQNIRSDMDFIFSARSACPPVDNCSRSVFTAEKDDPKPKH